MEWKIIEFETIRGERPVTEFIKKQQSQTIAKIGPSYRSSGNTRCASWNASFKKA